MVTGAYGLIGHEVVLQLRAAGEHVIATDQLGTAPADAGFDAVALDIAGVEQLSSFLADHKVSAIVHAAGISGPMLARDDPYRIGSVNTGGTLDLLEAARRSSVGRFIYLSSVGVYGATDDGVVGEDHPLRSLSVYGASKIAAEAFVRAYGARHGIGTVILRPCWVYGLRRRTECVIRRMVGDALAGRPTSLPFGGGFPRQFVHVGDVARAIVLSLRTPLPGLILNISDGTRHTIDEVARLIASILPQAKIDVAPGPDPDDDYLGLLDIAAAAERLDWRPSGGLEHGLRTYLAEIGAAKPPLR